MDSATLVAMAARLKDEPPACRDVGEIPAERYRSDAWFQREQAAVFARRPQLVAAEAELSAPGACLATELAGVPIIVTRTPGGLAAFHNSCRHRSTRLLAPGAPCKKTAFVCPYHGWTYDLHGRLVHVPHEESFAGRCEQRRALAPVFVEARHGLVWASLEPTDARAHLGGIDDELAAIELPAATLYQRTTREVRGNWKLIVDAFLDGYHLRQLHRDSIYPFFLDGVCESERAGPHVRSVVGRRALREGSAPLRMRVTPTYFIFPNTIVVLHPDFVSTMTCAPLSIDRTRFVHLMWVPHAARDAAEAAHQAKSHALIDGKVFGEEDLGVVEAIQAGLASRSNETLLFGGLEQPVLWFHAAVAEALGAAP